MELPVDNTLRDESSVMASRSFAFLLCSFLLQKGNLSFVSLPFLCGCPTIRRGIGSTFIAWALILSIARIVVTSYSDKIVIAVIIVVTIVTVVRSSSQVCSLTHHEDTRPVHPPVSHTYTHRGNFVLNLATNHVFRLVHSPVHPFQRPLTRCSIACTHLSAKQHAQTTS